MDYKRIIKKALDLTETMPPVHLHDNNVSMNARVNYTVFALNVVKGKINFATLAELKNNIEKIYRKSLYDISIQADTEDSFIITITF